MWSPPRPFPLTSAGTPGGLSLGDYRNQPADVSFVITQMLRLSRERHTGLTHLINRHHIAVGGHSLGAITTIGLLNTCCIDKRIDAVVPISGLELPFGGGSYTFERRTPILLVHGNADGTVPYSGSQKVFADARAPKFLLTLVGGPHTPFVTPWVDVIVRSITDFLDYELKGHHHRALHRLLHDAPNPAVATLDAAVR